MQIADTKTKEAQQKEHDADGEAKVAQERSVQVQQQLEELQQKRSDLNRQNGLLIVQQAELKRQLHDAKYAFAHQTFFIPYPKLPTIQGEPTPMRLGADVYTISGKVVDENGLPLADVELSVDGDVGHLRLMTHTDSRGIYTLSVNSDTISYRITFTKSGYQSHTAILGNDTSMPAGNPRRTGPDGSWTHPNEVVLHKIR